MTSATISLQLTDRMKSLPLASQQKVLDYAKSIASGSTLGPGTPGKDLLRFAGTISKEDLALMEQAIEEDCEQIDPNGW